MFEKSSSDTDFPATTYRAYVLFPLEEEKEKKIRCTRVHARGFYSSREE